MCRGKRVFPSPAASDHSFRPALMDAGRVRGKSYQTPQGDYSKERATMKRDLTSEDLRICALVTEGKQNKHIANDLGVSLEVATQRLKMIMRHIDASNRAMVAAWYVRRTEVRQ
jgi:DNA-binding NarL/FixJ family response regulator